VKISNVANEEGSKGGLFMPHGISQKMQKMLSELVTIREKSFATV
jgi:hypothetical protein